MRSGEVDYPELTRETVDMMHFESLKTMDGCGPELNAMIQLINSDLDAIEDDGSDLENSEDDNNALDLAEYEDVNY